MTDQPKDDPSANACPKCGGERVAAHLGNTAIFANDAKKGGIFVKGTGAWLAVCTTCGYSEMYASDPQSLKPQNR